MQNWKGVTDEKEKEQQKEDKGEDVYVIDKESRGGQGMRREGEEEWEKGEDMAQGTKGERGSR